MAREGERSRRPWGEEMTKILRFTSAPVGALLVLLLVITMVSGVTGLFTHYFPAIPTSATMTTTCPWNFDNSYLVSDPSSVVEGSSGQISFQCPNNNPAFTIGGGVVTATPYQYYGFVAPYTTLWIYQWDGSVTTGACSGRTGARLIESGVTEVDIALASYSYCAEYVNVGSSGLPQFTWYWIRAGNVFLFYHGFPAVLNPATMTSTCANGGLVPDLSTVDQGSSGQVAFQCPGTSPAFTISGGTFSAIPYFGGFAAPYTTLWIYQSDGTTTTGPCTGRTAARQLEDTVTEVDMAPLSYTYCAEYVNVGGAGLAAFSVSWTST